MSKQPFNKPHLSIDQHIALLRERGLHLEEEYAKNHLHNIGYFRLIGYFCPLLEQPKEAHHFKEGSNFEQAMTLYKFDRKLRLLLFSQIEKIEIAIRSFIVEKGLMETNDVQWLMNKGNFRDESRFQQICDLLDKEWNSSKEDFVCHFNEIYSDNPPIWMIIELILLGALAHLFQNIRKTSLQKSIAKEFGLPPAVLVSWMFSLSGILNICFYHNHLWNKVLPDTSMVLTIPHAPWIDAASIDRSRTYYKMAMVKYLLEFINPKNVFKEALLDLHAAYPSIDFRAIGFTKDWEQEPLWQS